MDSYDDLTTHTRRASGSQMLLEATDPEAVLLSIVDDRLIISIPEATGRPSLLPEDYVAVADRPRSDDELARRPGAAAPVVPRPEKRSIARAQARSTGEWVDTHMTTGERSGAKAQRAPEDNVIVDERLIRRPDEIRHEKTLRQRRRLGRILIVSLTFGIVGAALYNSAVIRVTKVNVTGNVDMSDENIVQALAVADEPSMFDVKVKELRQRLVALPLIADAQISKRWPNTLDVQVVERFGVATIASPAGWIILDQQGVVLDRRAQRPNLPSLLIDGKEIDANAVSSGPIPNTALTPALVALSSAPSKLMVLVDQVSVTNGELAMTLRRSSDNLGANGGKAPRVIQVNFGRAADVVAKWKAIDTLRDRVDLTRYALIDVSVAGQPALVPTVSSLPPTTTLGGN
jgi:cell division septal protein FtsQ